MAGASSPSFKFWFDEKWYTAQGAETMFKIGTKDDIATMRAEYTRMRDVAQKRIKRLGKEFPQTKAYTSHKYYTGKVDKNGKPIYAEGFQKLRNIEPWNFAQAFSDLAKFLNAKGSTVTGQRSMQDKTIASLNKAIGADGSDDDEEPDGEGNRVTKGNYWRVIDLLEESRRMKIVYDSDKLVALAELTMGLNKGQFKTVIRNLDTFVRHKDEYRGAMNAYMKENNIKSVKKVNMTDFKNKMEW